MKFKLFNFVEETQPVKLPRTAVALPGCFLGSSGRLIHGL